MSAVFPPQGTFTFRASIPEPPGTGGAKRGTGLVVVAGLHVVVAWALATGLAREAVEVIKKPIQMAIIEEVAPPPPPPPPPPPKVEKIKEVRRVQAPPPPAYVPPPDIRPEVPPPAPPIQVVQAAPPPEPVVIAPPPPPAPAVVKQEISLACPGYQSALAQTLEDAFDRVGVVGTVRVALKVRGSQVVEAVPVSGPKEYYKYVQTAVKRMHCSAGGAEEVQVSLDVRFQQ